MEIMTQQQQQEKSSLLLDMIKKEKTLYPGAIKLLFNEKDALPVEEQQQQQHEYDQLNHLDQLYVIACRLYQDLNLSNHKYIAYQLALLYVSSKRRCNSYLCSRQFIIILAMYKSTRCAFY